MADQGRDTMTSLIPGQYETPLMATFDLRIPQKPC